MRLSRRGLAGPGRARRGAARQGKARQGKYPMPIKPATFGKKVNPAEASRIYNNTTRRNTPALALAQHIRNSANWRNFRKMFLAEHPLCTDPYKNCGVRAASDVHHIVGLAVRPDWAFLESNCAALCEHCHSKVEADERAGKPTQGLFRNG